MRIDTIELFRLNIPLRSPRWGVEGPQTQLDTVLLRLESGGVSGWSEAAPGATPVTTAEWSGGVFACAEQYLAPKLLHQSADAATIREQCSKLRGNSYAKSLFDLAWWDLSARQRGKPLPELLGAVRNLVLLGAVIDQVPETDHAKAVELHLRQIQRVVEAGYSRLGLKIRPGWDINMLNFVRREFGSMLMHGDVEGALTPGYTEILCRFDDFFLKMLEQPLSPYDLVSSAMLQENIRTKICLDEAISTKEDATIALDLHAGKCFNIKPQRVGGLSTALEIIQQAEREEVQCWVGGLLQTAIGARFGLALAAHTAWDYPTDYFDGAELLESDIADAPELFRDETKQDHPLCAKLWTEPGIGIEPDADILERYTVEHLSLT